jgi:tripartite-type tricarboxylate transporter receptor subunit TctC
LLLERKGSNPMNRFPGIVALAALALTCGLPFAQTYPSKPIRLIIDFPAGGPSDGLARVVGQKLTESLGQPVVFDNRPGANGVIAYSLAAKAPADGYTLVILSTPFPLNAALQRKLTYDTMESFTPISHIANYTNVLVVHPSVPAQSVREFVAYAKSRTAALTYASSGTGSVQHLAMELVRRLAGFEAIHVPYAGSAPAMVDLVGGHVQASITTLPTILPYTSSGRLRALGVLSATRVSRLPDVPTLVESGVAVVAPGWGGIGAPAGVPVPIVRRLNAEIVRIVNLPDVRDRIVAFGGEPRHSSPEEFRRFIGDEMKRWAPVIRESGASMQN